MVELHLPTPSVARTFTLSDTPLSLAYELHGSGPKKVLLIMGLMTDMGAWGATVNYLTGVRDGYECCIYDNRGIGKSTTPKERYTTTAMAADAIALLNHLKWQTCHLVGISMGGMIALETALSAPERFISLTLLTTTAGGIYQKWSGTTKVMGALARPGTTEQRARSQLSYLYGPKTLADPQRYDRLFEYHRARIAKRIIPKLHGVVGHLSAVTTHMISVNRLLSLRFSGLPVFVAVGTEDELIRERHSAVLRDVLNASFLELSGAGHGLIAECGDVLHPAMYKHMELSATITHPIRTSNSATHSSAVDVKYAGAESASGSASALHPTYRGERHSGWLHALSIGCQHKSSCTALSLKAAFVGFVHMLLLQFILAIWLRIAPASVSPSSAVAYLIRSVALAPSAYAAIRGLVRIVPCIIRGIRAWSYANRAIGLRSLSRYGLAFPTVPLIAATLYSWQLMSSIATFVTASPVIALSQ